MTSDIIWTLGLGFATGLAGTLGAVAARFTSPGQAGRDFISAFGAGALVGAVGLVLLPHGVENLPLWLAILIFAGGGLLAVGTAILAQAGETDKGGGGATLSAMMLDFVPEAIVLGALITVDFRMAAVVAVIIIAQNGPEGFAAYGEMVKAGEDPAKVLVKLSALPVVGLVASGFGLWVCGLHDVMLGVILCGASGGILYLVLKTVIPDARTEACGVWPPYGGVLGFTVALIGYGLTAH